MVTCPICGREENGATAGARLTYLDGREVRFCLQCFVDGTVSEGAPLLLGPPTAGKTVFRKTLGVEETKHQLRSDVCHCCVSL